MSDKHQRVQFREFLIVSSLLTLLQEIVRVICADYFYRPVPQFSLLRAVNLHCPPFASLFRLS